ncbi:tail fiber domain-containing protein [Escherichia coli]|nr:tail fiber domain-containing protein [Escherichia coli]
MSAGTLTLTNNSDIVTGIGTSFATELDAGDFVVVTVGGVPYTLPVKSVESDTDLTLVSNFTGPTQSGAAWSAVPRVALNMVTAALVAQSAEALRGLNYDKQNWQQVFSAAGNITVKLPDGTTFTGPSWKYLSDNMATKSGGAVPVNQGGTGSTSASGARANLGLGSSATKDVGTAAGNVMQVGAFGVGGPALQISSWRATEGSGFYQSDSYAPTATTYSGVKALIRDGVQFAIVGRASRAFIQTNEGGSAEGWREITTTAVSDLSLKSDVEYGDGSESLANISAMKPVTFRFTRDKSGHQRRGLIAQDLEQIDPQYIRRVNGAINEDGSLREILTLDTNPLLMDALVVLKLLIDKDNQRTSEIEALKSEIEEIRARLPPMPS